MAKIYISGNTYPVKEQLRSLGCRWDGQRKAWYTESSDVAAKAKAIVEPHPIYNSPPPVDLGTADPVALAATHGRKAKDGAKVLSFSCTGLAKGDNGLPDGSIRLVKGVRYVQVARTKRQYLSRDYLEDMDMFSAEPGGAYQWDGVAIEPTAEELAADVAKAQAKEAKERPIKRRAELEALVRSPDRHSYQCDMTGLAKLWGDARSAGSETMYGDATRLVYVTSSYDDGPHYWELIDAALAAEAMTLKTS